MATARCPCDSGAPYATCCAPFHCGAAQPGDPVALMRSRYTAFAKDEAEYLADTLHGEHPDRERPRVELVRALRDGARSHRYMGLTIIESAPENADGIARVLFVARVFERGRDRSFVELSEFARERGAWRYLAGEGRPTATLRVDPATLTIQTFFAVIGS